jgi:hypothetical protein
MADQAIYLCAVCGTKKSEDEVWFLVSENRWEDQLSILHWHEEIAGQPHVRGACSSAHMQELVVRWITRGSLDHPAAKLSRQRDPIEANSDSSPQTSKPVPPQRIIAEIAVHRESLARALDTNLLCLAAMLDELWDALNHEKTDPVRRAELNHENMLAHLREI